MSHAIQLGPLLLPFTLVLVLASVGLTVFLGNRVSGQAGADVEGALWRALLLGAVVSRLAFVYEYKSLYSASPLSIVDVRDGGWNATAGLVAAWLYALYRERRSPALGKPLRWSLAAGSALFVLGTALMSLAPDTGQRLPALAFTSLEGRTVELRQFEGKPTIVNLWATWCPPCRREMPALRDAQRRHPGFNFVFINQGEQQAHVARWLQGQQLSLQNVLLDEQRQASAAFQQKGYPTTLFVNPKGEVVSTRLGELSPATLAAKLELLKRP